MRIEEISSKLVKDANGIYSTASSHDVSYAPYGHAQCFLVEDWSFLFIHRNACIAAMMNNYPFKGTLLDIGGGNGYVSQGLVKRGHEVVLIEPGIVGAYNARTQRGLEHVICSTVESAGFREGAFGALGLFDVIEHIEDDRSFLESLLSLIPVGGRLYLSVPCHSWLWSQADVEAGHFRRHTKKSLGVLLGGIFTIDYLSHIFRPLMPLQFLMRALPYRLGLKKTSLISNEAEHGSERTLPVKVIEKLLKSELRKVSLGKELLYGSSCLVAAHKSADY
jgi:SAM-dependent methyltransferase